MSLERQLKTVSEARGLLHQLALRGLRLYIKEHSEEELIKEIDKIKEAALLRFLWEAGLSASLQDAVLDRLKKIS